MSERLAATRRVPHPRFLRVGLGFSFLDGRVARTTLRVLSFWKIDPRAQTAMSERLAATRRVPHPRFLRVGLWFSFLDALRSFSPSQDRIDGNQSRFISH